MQIQLATTNIGCYASYKLYLFKPMIYTLKERYMCSYLMVPHHTFKTLTHATNHCVVPPDRLANFKTISGYIHHNTNTNHTITSKHNCITKLELLKTVWIAEWGLKIKKMKLKIFDLPSPRNSVVLGN